MSPASTVDFRLELLAGRIRHSPAPWAGLFQGIAKVLAVPAPPEERGESTFLGLIAGGAGIDAALDLAARAAPDWRLRRLAYDDAEWLCSLSVARDLPLDLDDMAEYRHVDPALAILGAVIEARRKESTTPSEAAVAALTATNTPILDRRAE